MAIEWVIAIACGAFILGVFFAMMAETRLLTFKFNSGYRQAARDILRDSICKDIHGCWHQLEMTWKDHKAPKGMFY